MDFLELTLGPLPTILCIKMDEEVTWALQTCPRCGVSALSGLPEGPQVAPTLTPTRRDRKLFLVPRLYPEVSSPPDRLLPLQKGRASQT